MRIAYQNLQCLGRSSDPLKAPTISADLRNFPVWFPDAYLFVECGTSLNDVDYTTLGRTLFGPSRAPGSAAWGFQFDYCDPHKAIGFVHGQTEAFAVFIAHRNNPHVAARANGLIQYAEASYEQDAGILGARERSYGTRQLGRILLQSPATGNSIAVLLCHPSPTNAESAVLTLLLHAHQYYVQDKRPFIIVGDLNVEPDAPISMRGRDTLKSIAETWVNRPGASPGLLGFFDCCRRRKQGSNSFTVRELAEYYGMTVKSPGTSTHAHGELDYLICSAGLNVGRPGVLPKTPGGSDHAAIYFDLDF